MKIKNTLIIVSLISTALLSGCAGTQVVDSISGDGAYSKVAVPIGSYGSIGAIGFVGRLNHTTIVNPVSSNSVAPKVVVAVVGKGRQGANGLFGGGVSGSATNANASLTDASYDGSVITTGDADASATFGTNRTVTAHSSP